MGRLVAAVALCALCVACGGREVRRPLDLRLGGLSVRADRLVLLLVLASDGLACDDVTPETAQGLDAVHRAEWVRSDDAEARTLVLPDVGEEAMTVVAYAEDADGDVIQVACSQIEYADLESPDISLQLSPAPRD